MTRSRVLGRTPTRPFRTRETVATPTPARAATSAMRAGLPAERAAAPGSGSISNKRGCSSSLRQDQPVHEQGGIKLDTNGQQGFMTARLGCSLKPVPTDEGGLYS